MSNTLHVLGISGSLRKASYNTALLKAAQELLPEGMELEIFDLSAIPLFHGDVEAVALPEAVKEFQARITAADAVLIATPEYNYSISGVLKNAIDWASRSPTVHPLNDKPLAMMGAGGRFGTARAQYHLRQICVFLNMHPLNKPEVMIQMAWEKFDKEGRLTDETSRQQVKALLEALAVWTHRLKSTN